MVHKKAIKHVQLIEHWCRSLLGNFAFILIIGNDIYDIFVKFFFANGVSATYVTTKQ